jgi:hypothetical protein
MTQTLSFDSSEFTRPAEESVDCTEHSQLILDSSDVKPSAPREEIVKPKRKYKKRDPSLLKGNSWLIWRQATSKMKFYIEIR